MEKKNKVVPIVRLELNSGVFRIKTDDAVYEITVQPHSSISTVVDDVVKEEKRATENSVKIKTEETPQKKPEIVEKSENNEKKVEQLNDDPFADTGSGFEDHRLELYQEISEEMFNQIGKLARQLSLSIKGLPEAFDNKMDIEQAGLDIENAKGMLENVVRMTEKATMEIMDISENINDNCSEIKQNLEDIKKLHFLENKEEEEAVEKDNPADDLIKQLIENESRLKELIKQQPSSEKVASAEVPAAEPQGATKTVYKFDIDVVFQTLYELCTNETVKKNHIKLMRENIDSEFDVDEIQKAFSDMAPDTESEDGFFNFQITSILKILFQFSKNEKNRQVLKKMNQTAASIFLDQILPIEGQEEQIEEMVQTEEPFTEAETESEEAAAGTELDEIIEANLSNLNKLAGLLKDGIASAPSLSGYSMLKKEDHDCFVAALESTDSVIKKILENIKRILETLTFQDLSGQKILKIVDTLSFVQVQLLGILVAFGAKLRKIRKEDEEISWDETEDVEDEFNKLISAGKEEEGEKPAPLDQGAVDKLLAELGF